MSTDAYSLDRGIVRAVDPATGISQVEMPGSMGAGGLVPIHPIGLTQTLPGVWDAPAIGSSVFIASNVRDRPFFVGPMGNAAALNASAGAVIQSESFATNAALAASAGAVNQSAASALLLYVPYVSPWSSTHRPTVIGLRFYESDTGREMFYDGTGYVIMSEPEQTYTPALTNLTIGGTSSVQGRYHRQDGWCDFAISLSFGSVFSITGQIEVDLPIDAGGLLGTDGMNLTVEFFHSGLSPSFTANNMGVSARRIILAYISSLANGVTAVDATHPWTWVSGDAIWIQGRYRMTTRYS